MNFWKAYLNTIKDPARNPYERRFRVFAPVGMITVLIWLIVISIMDYNALRLIFFSALLTLYFLTFIVSIRKGWIQGGAAVCTCGMVFVLMPYVFLMEGGIYAGAFNYTISALIFIMMTTKGRLKIILIAADLLTAHVLFLLTSSRPSLFVIPEQKVLFVNAYTEMIIPFILTLASIGFQLYMFSQDRERLEAQRNEVEDLNQAQNRFFSSMSHEIRTPINTIIGMNELVMRDDSLSDDAVEKLDMVHSASRMLLQLINDILDMSKMESGKMDIVPVEYDTASMLKEVASMISVRASAKGLKFNAVLDETLPSRLHGDEVRIKQVLVNLLNNAVKYTANGSVTMSVQGDRLDDINIRLTFRVEDTGIGIRKETIPYLFDAFKRVDEEKIRNIEGTGLGLSIVKQLVELMGGDISVSSVYTKGSVFSFSLVQEIVDGSYIGSLDTLNAESRVRDTYKQSFEAPDASILIVDDNEMNLAVETGLLKDTKIRTDTSLSGEKALYMTTSNSYDVIFMDHLMPEMDGIECLRRIRQQEGGLNRETPVIVLTANAGAENEALYMSAGFDGYILKPVSSQQLESALLRLLPANKVSLSGVSTMQSGEDEVFKGLGRKQRVRITMDSAGDLPKDLIERMDIGVMNFFVRTDKGFFSDNLEIDSDELLHYLSEEGNEAGSIVPDTEQYERFFGDQLSKARHVIHISISGTVSNAAAVATAAASSFENVTVIDSEALSSATGMLALYAADLANSGIPVEEMLTRIGKVRSDIHTSFVLDDGDHLTRGGHLPRFANSVLDAFLLHPVIVLRGNAMRMHISLGGDHRGRYIRSIFRRFRNIDPSLAFITCVGMSEREISEVKDSINALFGFDRLIVVKASSAVAVNSGPGTFGVIFRTFGDDRERAKKLFDFLPGMTGTEETVAEEEVTDPGMIAELIDMPLPVIADEDDKEAPLLDMDEAMRLCGTKDIFDNAVRIFVESARVKSDDIEKSFEEEDWENFTIRVHALKSASRLIGATKLSKDAERLEALGNEARGNAT